MYPDERVARFITENFIPARVHVRDQAQDFQRLGAEYEAQWTPTILELDPEGKERHRIEGFLTADDFLAQLRLGVGHAAFKRGMWEEAQGAFDEIVKHHAGSDAAPEARYWAGVSRYKASGNPAALTDTARALDERYADSTWAKKASIWKA